MFRKEYIAKAMEVRELENGDFLLSSTKACLWRTHMKKKLEETNIIEKVYDKSCKLTGKLQYWYHEDNSAHDMLDKSCQDHGKYKPPTAIMTQRHSYFSLVGLHTVQNYEIYHKDSLKYFLHLENSALMKYPMSWKWRWSIVTENRSLLRWIQTLLGIGLLLNL